MSTTTLPRFKMMTDRTYSFEDALYRRHPAPDPVETTPLPALPKARPDIALDSARYRYEWLTPDGFYIDVRHPKPIVRDGSRRTVQLDDLSPDLRSRLIDDIEEAQFRMFGGHDTVLAECGLPHDVSKLALWQAVCEDRPIDFINMTPAKQPTNPVLEMLAEREFNIEVEPPPLTPVFSLAGVPVSTPANLTAITSAVKTGKSAVIGAMAAAAMPHADGVDLLGFKSSNLAHAALVWFDSEQSPDDFWHCVFRAVKRAGLHKPPPWLHAYSLAGLGHARAWEAVQAGIQAAGDLHDGLHSILIDGFADMLADVNDPAESNDFVAALHDLAIQNYCPIIGVIHFNPGSEKSRGHLGSQIERKAETNLALEKDSDETTVIYSTKNRRAGIPKNQGPRFAFSVDAGMHVTVESRQSAKDAERRETLLALAQDVFSDRPAMRYSDLKTTVMTVTRCKERMAERKISEMRRFTVIKATIAGLYEICTPAYSK